MASTNKIKTIQNEKKGPVQSLSRAFSILRYIAEHPHGARLSEIADGVGLPSSTVHRLLTSLEAEQFIRFETSVGQWFIGVDAFTIGNAFVQANNVLQFAPAHLKALLAKFSETSSIYIENEGEVVCMGQAESHHMMRAITRVGGRVKMHCSGSGKVMLAFWDTEDVKQIINRHGLTAVTEKTITTKQKFENELQGIRQQGYAVDDEEVALGVRCVAVPIFDHQQKAIAALSVSGPISRIHNSRLREISAGMKEIAIGLSKEVGGDASPIC